MPERYGNWNSVFVRFTRWSKLGVWDAVLETLASLCPPADEEHAIDSTIVRAHQHAAWCKRGVKGSKRSGRSRGGFSTKIHLRTNAIGDPTRQGLRQRRNPRQSGQARHRARDTAPLKPKGIN